MLDVLDCEMDGDLVLVEHEGASLSSPELTEVSPTRCESSDSIPSLEDIPSDEESDGEGSEEPVSGDKSGGPPKASVSQHLDMFCGVRQVSTGLLMCTALLDSPPVLTFLQVASTCKSDEDDEDDDEDEGAQGESLEAPRIAASAMQPARALDSCARALACALCVLLLLSPLVCSSRLMLPLQDDWQALAAQAEWLPTPAWMLSAEERSNSSFVQVPGPPGSRLQVFVTSQPAEPTPPAPACGQLQHEERVLAIRLPSGASCTSWTALLYRVAAGALCVSASLAWGCATIALAVTQAPKSKSTALVAHRLRSWLARIAQRETMLLCLLLGLPVLVALVSYLRVLALACGAEHGLELRESGVGLFRAVPGSTPQAVFVPSALLDPVDRFASRFKLASVALDFRQLRRQEVGFVQALIDKYNEAESSSLAAAHSSCATGALLQGFVSSNLGSLIEMQRTSYSAVLTLGNVLIGSLPDPAAAKTVCHSAVSVLKEVFGEALRYNVLSFIPQL